MSSNRDKEQDKVATQDVLSLRRFATNGDQNWLGHGSHTGAARIDQMLITGATLVQMGESRGAQGNHVRHLRKEHDLTIDEVGGVYCFHRV